MLWEWKFNRMQSWCTINGFKWCYLCILDFFFCLVNSVLQTLWLLAWGQIRLIRRKVDVLCSRFLNARGSRGAVLWGVHFREKHCDSLVTCVHKCRHYLTPLIAVHPRFVEYAAGGFLQFPRKIGCISLFKYCKGFLLKKVIKKHSDTHLLNKVALHHTSALHIPSVSGNTLLK